MHSDRDRTQTEDSETIAGGTTRPSGAGAQVAVLLPLPLQTPYDYCVPDDQTVAAGDFVLVPLGGRTMIGVVWGPGSGSLDESRLKPIRSRLPAPPLPAASRRFVDWVAAYTVQPAGTVLRMAMSVTDALQPPRPARVLRPAEALPAGLALTPARRRVLDVIADGRARPATELARAAGCGTGVIRGLLTAGALIEDALLPPAPPAPDWRLPGLVLSAAQTDAAQALSRGVGTGFSVSLLDGTPGAGKTEVYFEAIAHALSRGLQVLVLLPEIALSTQWRRRFYDRFGAPPAEWHSDLSSTQRRQTWRAVADGTADVVVGARSALFLPYPRLGLIVVDEEHDGSFKQEDGVAYHARDMAVVRARLGEIACVLVSATPSLETVANVRAGRYREVPLPRRTEAAPPPHVEIVDLRCDRPPRGRFIAPRLHRALTETLDAGAQAMLFLNRRGYAPLTLCRSCGHRLRCPSCTAWLVEHRLIGRLQCHHCGFAMPLPSACPACHEPDVLAACGPGVERLAEEVATLLPGVRTVVATSDTLGGPAAAAELVVRIERREVDLIIGTQIVAKGYHFPGLTLVGAIDADLGLAGGELRASERTFQLLYQLAGRAGRETPGRVLLQTCCPEHPVIGALAAGDRDRFLAVEEAERRADGMPPYGRLAALIVSGRDETVVEDSARALALAAPTADGVRLLGPAPPPLALLRGRHRRRLLLIAPRAFPLSSTVRDWLAAAPQPASVRVQVDIDPQSFL